MGKEEIIERLEEIAKHAVHVFGEIAHYLIVYCEAHKEGD